MSRRRGGSNLGLLLLGGQILNIGVDNIPPVTLGLIGGQVAIFLDCFHKYFPSAYGVCMSPYLITQHRDWYRLILGALYHADDMHLYFNMVSLLYKGLTLERKFGSPYYAYLVATFTALTSLTYVSLGMLFGKVLDPSYTTSCAVGFSGVVFALKVLATEYSSPGTQYAFGFIPVPSKYLFWAELVLIQLITPNASFVGHLAGILVGLAYTKGPLKPIMDSFIAPDAASRYTRAHQSGQRSSNIFSQLLRGGRPRARFGPHPSGPQGGMATGYATPGAPPPEDDLSSDDYPRASARDFNHYTGGLNEDEQMRRAMAESMSHQPHHPHQPYQPHQLPRQGQSHEDDEQEELQRALEESLRSQKSSKNAKSGLYPNVEELRSRRAHYYK